MPADPYSTREWRRLTPVILERDGWRCQIRGPKCRGDATEVDHIIPVEAGGAWYDPVNLRASCLPCNRRRAAVTKTQEGWRRSATRIVLVVGPPGAGKSTHVEQHRDPADVVVDYDRIAEALGSTVSHGHQEPLHELVQGARGSVLRRIRRGEVDAPRVWIVSANPTAEAMFPHHDVVEVDPGRDETVARAVADGRPPAWLGLIDDWYASRRGLATSPGGPSRAW